MYAVFDSVPLQDQRVFLEKPADSQHYKPSAPCLSDLSSLASYLKAGDRNNDNFPRDADRFERNDWRDRSGEGGIDQHGLNRQTAAYNDFRSMDGHDYDYQYGGYDTASFPPTKAIMDLCLPI